MRATVNTAYCASHDVRQRRLVRLKEAKNEDKNGACRMLGGDYGAAATAQAAACAATWAATSAAVMRGGDGFCASAAVMRGGDGT